MSSLPYNASHGFEWWAILAQPSIAQRSTEPLSLMAASACRELCLCHNRQPLYGLEAAAIAMSGARAAWVFTPAAGRVHARDTSRKMHGQSCPRQCTGMKYYISTHTPMYWHEVLHRYERANACK
jgi:hypothetical protein